MIKDIFEAGVHTDSNGKTRNWTEKEIDKFILGFDKTTGRNSKGNRIPMCVGHPKTNSPAYGWVGKLWRSGKKLFAEFVDVVDEMKTAIRKKMFRETSISVNPDGSLGHVGFLGAKPPAVAGLGDIQFEENKMVTINYCSQEEDEIPNFNFDDLTDFQDKRPPTTVQTLIFDKKIFPTADSVRAWIKEHPKFKVAA